MRYTRVKVVTCALTASVMLYGSAVQIHATETAYALPAAGVGLTLEEGPSLASVQEEAVQSEKAAEAVQEVQETQAVTSADIESGVTGVGESTIDEKVVTHVQEQQMEDAINNGVGVASILSSPSEQEEEQVPSVEEAGSLVVYNEEGGTVIVASSVERMIVEPVDLKETKPAGEEEADVPEKDEEQDETAAPVEEKKEEAAESADTEKKETSATEEKENKEENEQKEEKENKEEKEPEQKESEEKIETEETEEEKKEENKENEDVKDDQASEETDVPAKETTDTEEESNTAAQEPESKPAETQDAPVDEPTVQEPEVPVVEESAEAPASEPVVEGSPATGEVEVVPASSGAGNAVVDYALQFVGNPYSYGGSSLTNGTDCSGFVMSVYKNFGVSLPHSSSGDRKVGSEVGGGLANAQPGDIVCYSGHVGIYIGDNKIVHASTESTGIKVSDADYKTPITVRRVIN